MLCISFFSEFLYKIFVPAIHDIISPQNFSLSFCQSLSRITMCNLHWCYTFCTGVTLELHYSQPIRIEHFYHVLLAQQTSLVIQMSFIVSFVDHLCNCIG